MKHPSLIDIGLNLSDNLRKNPDLIKALEQGSSTVMTISEYPDKIEQLALLRLPLKQGFLRLISHHPKNEEEIELYLSKVLEIVSTRKNARVVELVTGGSDSKIKGISIAQQVSNLLRKKLGAKAPLVKGYKTPIKVSKSGGIFITHEQDPDALISISSIFSL
jgi:hypothetical protein